MKYFVVSEEELEALKAMAGYEGFGAADQEEVDVAEAACRARPVGFLEMVVHDGNALWMELKDRQDG